jgi:hypothetical protein
MKIVILSFLILIILSCNYIGAGTLGSFDSYYFLISENEMHEQFDIFYLKHPNYKIPDKWDQLNDWNERGYSSLKGKCVYFDKTPEEIYYISYFELRDEDSFKEGCKTIQISVRAVHNGTWRWMKEEDYEKDKAEKDRIEKRFHDEIIVKLEKQLNTKAIKDNSWF